MVFDLGDAGPPAAKEPPAEQPEPGANEYISQVEANELWLQAQDCQWRIDGEEVPADVGLRDLVGQIKRIPPEKVRLLEITKNELAVLRAELENRSTRLPF